MKPRHSLIAICAAVVSGLAACGGGGDSAEKDISTAVEQGATSRDVKVRCEETTTQRLLRRIYGDVAQCHKAEKLKPSDKPPTDVRVSRVKVDGDRATATAVYEGGDTSGAKGTLRLLKEDDKWRIDDVGVDLLRSQVENGVDSGSSTLGKPKILTCARKALTNLPDAQLRRVAYATIAERPGSDAELGRVVLPCLSEAGSGAGSGSTSFLREKFEQGISSSLRKSGSSAAKIGCINGKLRSSISEEEIQSTATNGGKTTPQLTRKVAEAIKACPGQ